jgi:hypothetical protein
MRIGRCRAGGLLRIVRRSSQANRCFYPEAEAIQANGSGAGFTCPRVGRRRLLHGLRSKEEEQMKIWKSDLQGLLEEIPPSSPLYVGASAEHRGGEIPMSMFYVTVAGFNENCTMRNHYDGGNDEKEASLSRGTGEEDETGIACRSRTCRNAQTTRQKG